MKNVPRSFVPAISAVPRKNTRALRLKPRVLFTLQYVTSAEELDAFLSDAGDKLVFLSIESTEECDLGDYPDPQDVQRTVSDDPMVGLQGSPFRVCLLELCCVKIVCDMLLQNPCVRMKHALARVARECDDAVFLSLEVSDDTPELMALASELGVSRFPTFQVNL